LSHVALNGVSSAIVVLKFGGSILRGPEQLEAAAAEVARQRALGARIVAVVSAFQGRTDALERTARALVAGTRNEAEAAPAEVARLLASGETESAAAFLLALRRVGLAADILEPARVGPTCTGDPLDAEPVALHVAAFHAAFERAPVVVLPGWVGRTADGHTAVLGRGGSDLTALFVAHRLAAARCVLYKDVGALFERDPALDAQPRRHARRLAHASFSDTLDLVRSGAGIVQAKAVLFAEQYGWPFEIAALGGSTGTYVGHGPTVIADTHTDAATE